MESQWWWCRILPVMNCDTVGVNNDQLSNDPTSDKGEDDRASWSAAICCCPMFCCPNNLLLPKPTEWQLCHSSDSTNQGWFCCDSDAGQDLTMMMIWSECRVSWLRNTKPTGSCPQIFVMDSGQIKRLRSKGWLHPQCHHQSSSGQASSDKIMMWEHLGARWSVVKIFGMFGLSIEHFNSVNTGQDDNRRKFPHFPMEPRDSVGHNGQWAVKFDDRTQR